MDKIIIGTRGSNLALKQAEIVSNGIKKHFPNLNVEIKVIHSIGDKRLDISLKGRLAKGLFTEEIEKELIDGTIDMAVHSLKDLPIECTAGTTIGAYLKRANVSDVWIGKSSLANLPANSIIGTSSPRRSMQMNLLYPKHIYKEIRGNVETRIKKVEDGLYDGIIMAAAGIERLGLNQIIREYIPVKDLLPAPGQAAIAVHIREDDMKVYKYTAVLNDYKTEKEVTTERNILSSIGGGCSMPFGCYCTCDKASYNVSVFLGNEDGNDFIREEYRFEESEYDNNILLISNKLKKLYEK